MTEQQPAVLVVDDEQQVLGVLSRFAAKAGFDVTACGGGREAIARFQDRGADLALVDICMPDPDGLAVLRKIRQTDSRCDVVMMTGRAGVETAVEATRLGATDCLTKPLDFDQLGQLFTSVRHRVERCQILTEIEQWAADHTFCGMVGCSSLMQGLFDRVRRLAPQVRTALVVGEIGTGKDLVVHALHRMGPRPSRPLVTINCRAAVESRIDSELFGHVRGAFPGADEDKAGLLERADGGTVFVDEIGELPVSVHEKMQRFLEWGEICRVGSFEPRKVDVHILATAKQDLPRPGATDRQHGEFYHRVSVATVQVRPLRDHAEDIPYLNAMFVRECAAQLRKPILGTTAAVDRRLASAPWIGNVRELRNVIAGACMVADGELITDEDLDRLASQQTRPSADCWTG